jgi:DNA-binding XRE family transcriptional regulator
LIYNGKDQRTPNLVLKFDIDALFQIIIEEIGKNLTLMISKIFHCWPLPIRHIWTFVSI